MTAAEIRGYVTNLLNEKLSPSGATALQIVLVAEIAAQLADLNEHFRMVDEAVFGTPQAKSKKAGAE